VANASLRWDFVVLSLQQAVHKALHVGGGTAVELSGYPHYLKAGKTSTVYLYGQGAPSWLLHFHLRLDLNSVQIVY
jgi:hypothetical protein